MNEGDLTFAWQHAAKWAHGPWRTSQSAADELLADERATAYADWYVRTYVRDADSLSDLPSHPAAWDRYLEEAAE